MSREVRVRFAPSPTGLLHPGGARTALFNHLFARHHSGKLILRMEDTDRDRSKLEFVRTMLEDLRWLGLTFDEGPYHQSARAGLYDEAAGRLTRDGLAYRSEGALYLRPPAREGSFRDGLRGEVPFSKVPDFVILKSDGTPSYNFAAAVDDIGMGITHVIRGEEHLPNTARQAQIYRALKRAEPEFMHLGLLLGTDGKKLSKRHGALPISEYRRAGYLPQALTDHLALLGWSHPEGREEFDCLDELIGEWEPSRLGASPAVFDPERLLSINSRLIRATPPGRLWKHLDPFIGRLPGGREIVTVEALQQDLRRLCEAPELLERITGPVDPTPLAAELPPESAEVLEHVARTLEGEKLETLDEASGFVGELRGWAKGRGMKARDVLHPLRLALTGENRGPELPYVLVILGPNEATRRLESAQKALAHRG